MKNENMFVRSFIYSFTLSTLDAQKKSVAPLTVTGPKEGETQTINTAPSKKGFE